MSFIPTWVCSVCLEPYGCEVLTRPSVGCAQCGSKLYQMTSEGRRRKAFDRKNPPTR